MLSDAEGVWTCSSCGARHEGLLTCFGPDQPQAWHQARWIDRRRGSLNRDLCMVKVAGVHRFFVRGHLRIPLIGHVEPWLAWSVWVELEESDFASMMDSWDDPDRVGHPAIEATLDSALPYDTPTVGIPVAVEQSPPGEVPLVRVANEVDHAIAAEQRDGMTVHRLAEINAMLV